MVNLNQQLTEWQNEFTYFDLSNLNSFELEEYLELFYTKLKIIHNTIAKEISLENQKEEGVKLDFLNNFLSLYPKLLKGFEVNPWNDNSWIYKAFMLYLQTICNLITAYCNLRIHWVNWVEREQILFESFNVLYNHNEDRINKKSIMVPIILITNTLKKSQMDSYFIVRYEKGRQWLLKLITLYPQLDKDLQGLVDEFFDFLFKHNLLKLLLKEEVKEGHLNSDNDVMDVKIHELTDSIIQMAVDGKYNIIDSEILQFLFDRMNKLTHQLFEIMIDIENFLYSKDQEFDTRVLKLYHGIINLLELYYILIEKDPNLLNEQELKTSLFDLILKLLDKIDKKIPKVFDIEGKRTLVTNHRTLKAMKIPILQLLGHLCLSSTCLKNRLRIHGYLPLILNQCNIDDNQPYLREHGLFLINIIMENCPENQAFLHNLKAMQPTQHPVLQQSGVHVALDDSGKPYLKKLD